MPAARKPATDKADDAAVSAMENEGGPDPEVARLRKELDDLRKDSDERVRRATESAKLEKRPEESADPASPNHSVVAEIRRLLPSQE